MYEEVFATLTDLKLADYVHFLENISNQDLARLYNAACCLTLPSYYEGFGLPPLEAMACGTPVVVSNRASLPEVVGDAGILVNPDSEEELSAALIKIITDSGLRALQSQKGIARAGEFSWARAAHQTMDVYQRVLDGSVA
jgi:glycosyltransferase involved in cell wall biosynthesis